MGRFSINTDAGSKSAFSPEIRIIFLGKNAFKCFLRDIPSSCGEPVEKLCKA